MARILYLGDPQGGLALLRHGLVPVGIVHGRQGGPGWKALVPQVRDLPRFLKADLNDPTTQAALAALEPTLLVAGFYPRRIPPAVLALAPGINVHPSPLPRWRGPDPTHWTIRAGDPTTALCVHWLSEGLDEGDVLVREEVAVQPRETAGHLAERLESLGASLLAATAARLAAGESIPATPQAGEVTWAPLVPGEQLEVDWTRSATEVDALIRASLPWPGAFTGLGGELLVLLAGRVVEAGAFERLAPGTPFVRRVGSSDRLHIRCGEGAWRIDRARLGHRDLSGEKLARLLA